MTEYQKMLGGQLYNAQDGELQAMHRTAMELCHALNQLNPNQKEEARALLRQLLGRTGEHFTIKSTFWCDYGRHITIGVHRKDWNHEDYYPAFVEYGHGGPAPAPAHPYIRPAYDTRVDEAYEIIRDGLRDAIDRL